MTLVLVLILEWRSVVPFVLIKANFFLRTALRSVDNSASAALPGACSRVLYAQIPHHGLGNKLQWLGSSYILSEYTGRCLGLVIPSGEVFEDWGLTLVQGRTHFTLLPSIPAGIVTLSPQNVSTADGHWCGKVHTNCHAYAEGEVSSAFLQAAGNISVGSGFFALKPQGMALMDFDARMTKFLQGFEVLPHFRAVVDSVWQQCLRASTTGTVIGVHYRASDNCKDGNKLNMSAGGACAEQSQSITALKRVLGAHPGASVFFASDNVWALAKMTEALPGVRIVTSGSTAAVVDMRLLSMTHLIIGSKFSTFSYSAARWGGVSLIESGR